MRKAIFFAAVAAISLSACQKVSESVVPEVKTVIFNANTPETKTVFGEKNGDKYPVLWTDKTNVALSLNHADSKLPLEISVSSDKKTASFKAQFENPGAGPFKFVLFAPNAAVRSISASNKTLNIDFPASQESTADSPGEDSQIIYAVSEEYTSIPDNVSLTFKHAGAYLHLGLINAALEGATVKAVNLTFSKKVSGRWFMKTEDGSFSENSGSDAISISTTTLESVWCTLLPTDLSGETVSVVIATDKGTLSKTITIPSGSTLSAGKIAKLTIDFSGIALVAPQTFKLVKTVDGLYVGDKILVVSAGEFSKALGNTQNSGNRSSADITKDGETISDPAATVEIIDVEEGAIPGTFALKTAAGYLKAPGGGNTLHSKPEINAYSSWAVTIGSDGATKVIAQAPGVTQNELRYNSDYDIFSAYKAESSTNPVVLYRKDINPDTTPRFKASMPDANAQNVVSVSAAAGELEIYVFGNAAWTASVTGEGASLSATSGNGSAILTLSIPENTSETATPTYTVTVSTAASVTPASYTFTVNQSAKPGEGAIKVGDVLWGESWAGGTAGDTPAKYQARSTASTVVYGGGAVTYTHTASGTKLYMDGLVYLPNGTTPIPSGCNPANLLVGKTSGTWKITGIPCPGVKKAVLTYYSNSVPSSKRTVTTDTEGVTLSSYSNAPYTSEWNKTVNVISYEITFSDSFSGAGFNLQFNNTDSSNIRVTDATVTVTEVK